MSDSLELSRKLVSIYDALDHNQPKNALKLLKPILSRPNPPSIAVALSALAQVRSGRPDTAVELVRSLAEGGSPPTDEVTLQTCLAVVKLLGPSPPLHLIVTLYRNALQACTGHPEWNVRGGPLPPEALATGLYFSYLRTRDFPKMQQIGLRLHNSFGKQVKFLNWAIIPMLLQGDSKLIGLAENLLNRVEFKGNSQSVMLMIRCLKMQGKIIEAWDLVETCLEESLDKAELKIELAYSLEAQERYHFARKLIEEGKDDWKIIEILISSVIQLDNEKQSLLVEELLMNKREESRRSFTLGLLHFFKRLKNWEKFESLMSAFAMEFGKKPSFMDDCKGVLSGLEESWHPHVKELFIRLFTDLLKSSKLHEYPFFVNVAFAVSEGSLDTFSLFSTFASYLTSQEFLKLAPSEDGRFDSWIFVLIEQLLSLDEGLYALETCFLALYLLSMRQFSVDAKLYAIRLLCHKNVGCIQKAVEIFRSLDVKLVLLESVNHLILEDALRFGKTDIVNALCYDLLDFHSNYHKDVCIYFVFVVSQSTDDILNRLPI